MFYRLASSINKSLLKISTQTSLISLLALFTVTTESNAAEEKATELSQITVAGEIDDIHSTSESELEQVPGGTNLIDLDDLPSGQATLNDVLGTQPGVIMQEFFGGNDQPRLNIRGSGIQDNPVDRGVQLLYDGMTINQADNSFVIGLLDPQQTRLISVFRGANATELGGASLGGAINMASRNGENSQSFFRLQGGSFDTLTASVGIAGKQKAFDYYIGAGHACTDGYRNVSGGDRTNLSLNAGYKINDYTQNRTYLNYTDNYFLIPFVLPKQAAIDNPKNVIGDGIATNLPPPATLPAAAVGHPVFGWNAQGGWDGVFNSNNRLPHRDTQQLRIANKTTSQLGNFDVSFGVYAEDMDDVFTDPVSHAVIDSKNIGFNFSLANTGAWLTREDSLKLSVAYNKGDMPVEYWVNNREDGSKLFRFADLDQDASNAVVGLNYLGAASDRLQFNLGLQWMDSNRDVVGTASTPPAAGAFDRVLADIDSDFSFDGVNPKVGLIFKTSDQSRFYANISKSMEAPTFNQLVSRSVSPLIAPGAVLNPPAVPPFADASIASGATIVDLDKQTALTYEIGSKGSLNNIDWDVSLYHSKLEGELITLVTGFAVNAETLNYPDDTTHQGLEVGFGAKLGKSLFRGDDSLSTRITYNYSDFSFDGGVFSGNQIAGVPEHQLYGELSYSIGKKFTIAPNIRWQPDDTFVDHANTQVQDDYLLLGLKASYEPTSDFSVFTELKNITDETYQSSYVIRGISAANQPTFLPGSGLSANIGVHFKF